MSGLTGAQSGGRDLDLTGGLVRLEGRGSASSAEVCGEQVRALSPCGAGAGSIASMMGLLFFIHCDQLGGGHKTRCCFISYEKSTAVVSQKETEKSIY